MTTQDYDAFLKSVQDMGSRPGPVFTTDAAGLWETYLSRAKNPIERQRSTCNACRRFVERYGALVYMDASGLLTSVVWPQDSAEARLVRRANVTGVFLSQEQVWGEPKTGPWSHLSVTRVGVFQHPLLTAEQVMAEKRQDYQQLKLALNVFSEKVLEKAGALLESDALYRSEKVLGPVKWLLDLQQQLWATAGQKNKNHLLWRAVALAPPGFCHPRSSMAGSLLEDIASGLPFAEVSRRFAAKMNPLQYQRPQAAPSAGTIAQAEEIVTKLGSAGSLERRFARLEEVVALWRPKGARESGAQVLGGVFGHLPRTGRPGSPAPAGALAVPKRTMSWAVFARDVLPNADRIELKAPISGSYTSLITAGQPESPPILQWDTVEKRNPVSWYFYSQGSLSRAFDVRPDLFTQVDAVCLKPCHWHGPMAHHPQGVLLILHGAKDIAGPSSLCLFPEILKAEYRQIRSVIEAHSATKRIFGKEEQSAAGYLFIAGDAWPNHTIRVWRGSVSQEYQLDRWE